MRVLRLFFAIALASILLQGCAVTGNSFTVAEPPPAGMGTVYFYRPSMAAGSALSLDIIDNGKQATVIKNGQFVKYLVTPGHHKLHTDTIAIDKSIELDVEAGATYFVRTGLRQGFWVGTWYLSRVYEEEALEELRACCKSGG